jgi:adenylyltransferase/sulfurtransferase
MDWIKQLTQQEKERYHRQMLIKALGPENQVKLKKSKVLVIGVGGLGSPILYYLAVAGVGTLGFCDEDVVELHNLNRQILHFTENIKQPKVESAYEKLQALNPDVVYVKHYKRVDHSTIESIVQDYDVVVDATDNLSTRLLISDVCFLMNKPLVEGAVVGLSGTITTIIPHQSPCLRCLYPKIQGSEDFKTCAELGILGAVAGTIGSLQALEAIKVIAQVGETLLGRLLVFEGFDLEFETVSYEKNLDCPLCGERPQITTIDHCGIRFNPTKL